MITKSNSNKIIKAIFPIAFVLLIIYAINIYGIEGMREKAQFMGIWAPILIISLRSISIIIPALPSTAYSILAGGLFGFVNGLLFICIADLISCSLSFHISRKYGRNIITDLFGNKFIYKLENISKRHLENNFLLMTGFLMTGLFDFVCYAVGLSKVPWKKFYPALVISILLSNPPIVALGAGVLEGGKLILIVGVVGIFILGLISSKLQVINLS